ncbi:putative L-cysteine desulfhydrase 1 [Nymphaea thermarum]|nr:putative L-cysteine desulfhydrase 1 [Nymphaea thermarum]
MEELVVHENGSGNHGVPRKKPKLSKKKNQSLSEIVRQEFAHHDPNFARLNNGSFGCCPATVLADLRRWHYQFLSQPDRFYHGPLQDGIRRSREAIASLVNASHPDEIALVDNVTTAAAIVLHHIARSFSDGTFPKGDSVIMLHYAYGAVKQSVHAYCGQAGANIVEVEMPFPLTSNEEIISSFRKALEEAKSGGRKVRLAVIDHITSMPSVVIPVKQLTEICREEGVDRVFIDGAHSIGNIDIDLQAIGADFYTSNLHKWFFCPPSVAFLYAKKSASADAHHLVVTHEYGKGLAVESSWVGNRDYSAQLVIPTIIEFLKQFDGGLEEIKRLNHEKVVAMGKMLAEAWGTGLGTSPELSSSMIMVGLPAGLKIRSDKDAMRLRAHLRVNFEVEVPIYHVKDLINVDGKDCENPVTGYARISHQIYNTLSDYQKLRDAINKLVEDSITCEKLEKNSDLVLQVSPTTL